MGTQGEDRGKVAREVTGQRRVAFAQPEKGAGGEFGVKPKQQVNGCAVRGLMDWCGAEGSQREARKRPRGFCKDLAGGDRCAHHGGSS